VANFWVVMGDYAAPQAYRYLLPNERQVVAVRFHPAVTVWPILTALTGLLGALLLSAATLKLSPDDRLFIWLVWVILFIYAIGKVIYWATSHYVITSSRMLVIKGVFVRDVEMLPLASVTTLKLRRTFTGRVLGYGRFVVEGVGQIPGLRVINYIPYPERVYLEVCAVVFPDEASDN
jgi:hypothetical protein